MTTVRNIKTDTQAQEIERYNRTSDNKTMVIVKPFMGRVIHWKAENVEKISE